MTLNEHAYWGMFSQAMSFLAKAQGMLTKLEEASPELWERYKAQTLEAGGKIAHVIALLTHIKR